MLKDTLQSHTARVECAVCKLNALELFHELGPGCGRNHLLLNSPGLRQPQAQHQAPKKSAVALEVDVNQAKPTLRRRQRDQKVAELLLGAAAVRESNFRWLRPAIGREVALQRQEAGSRPSRSSAQRSRTSCDTELPSWDLPAINDPTY